MHHPTRSPHLTALVAGILASFAIVATVGAAGHETTLTAQLSGSAETDADGTGTASIVINLEEGTACWEMTAENIDPVTVSHIHEGAAGVDGGVVVDLDLDGFEGTSEGCNEAADADALQAIMDDPAGYYVNLHTDAYPGGAIRGQLAPDSPNTALPVSGSPVAALGLLLVAASAAIGARRLRSRTAA